MSPRWALAHVRHLPIESAFIAERRGGQQFRGWGNDRYASAALVNAARTLNYAFILANTDPKKGRKPKPPEMWLVPDKLTKQKNDGPGTFAWIAKQKIAAIRKAREAQCQQAESKSAASPSKSPPTLTDSGES